MPGVDIRHQEITHHGLFLRDVHVQRNAVVGARKVRVREKSRIHKAHDNVGPGVVRVGFQALLEGLDGFFFFTSRL